MERNQLVVGFAYGIAATILMTLMMAFGTASGASPIPEPIPKAAVTSLLGVEGPLPLVAGLAVGLHLAYGGVFGALLAAAGRPVTLAKGLGLGLALWLVMQLSFLPALGWGFFGADVTPKIAAATLALHLVYGGVLGWALGRRAVGIAASGVASAD